MFNSFWALVFMCSTGWILIILGNMLKVPPIFQIIMLVAGLVISTVGVIALTKNLLSHNKK